MREYENGIESGMQGMYCITIANAAMQTIFEFDREVAVIQTNRLYWEFKNVMYMQEHVSKQCF